MGRLRSCNNNHVLITGAFSSGSPCLPQLLAACGTDGWDIRFMNQPTQSPDLNVLDLGFFHLIQSLQDRTTPRTIDELIAAVNDAFDCDPPETLGKVWTTLQAVLQEIMLCKADNKYELPQLRKDTLATRGERHPRELPCSEEAWEVAQDA